MNLQLLHRLVNRPAQANKYDFGHVLIVGGSPGMVGAPLLAGTAALRMGAGLVTIASQEASERQLEKRVAEIMTLALPAYSQPDGAVHTLTAFVNDRQVTCVSIGPGLPLSAAAVVRRLAAELSLPLVLDAGALAAFCGHLESLRQATVSNSKIIITPHSGEFDRLVAKAFKDTEQRRRYARQFATQYQLTVVLKGHHTLVAHPDGSHYLNRTGNPGMATAGTGDVLTGVIAGLLAQKFGAGEAAEIGVYLHGLAGDLAAIDKTEAGVIASDLIGLLPDALKKALSIP